MVIKEAIEVLWSSVALALGLPALATSAAASSVVAEQPAEPLPVRARVDVNGLPFIVQAEENGYAITRPAPGILRFEVRSGDQYEHDVNMGKGVRRAEMGQTAGHFRFGDDAWISFSQRIVQLTPAADNQWVTLGQFHGPNRGKLKEGSDLGPPPLVLRYSGDTGLAIISRTGNERRGRSADRVHHVEQPAIGEWTHYVFHIRTGAAHRGLLEVWKNGEQIVDYQGAIGYRPGGGIHYWKFGIYENAADDTTRIVEYANMRVGSEDLSEKIGSPDPIPGA